MLRAGARVTSASEVDEVLLLGHGWVVRAIGGIHEVLHEPVGVDVIAVNLVIVFLIAGQVTLLVLVFCALCGTRRVGSGRLSDLPGSIHVG